MRIVGGLDIHRRQITFDYLDERSGQCRRGRIAPADRLLLRRWLQANLDGAPAAFAAAKCAARPGSPDHAYYRQVADRLGGNRAALSVARKITRRAHHTLRALGEEALAPV